MVVRNGEIWSETGVILTSKLEVKCLSTCTIAKVGKSIASRSVRVPITGNLPGSLPDISFSTVKR